MLGAEKIRRYPLREHVRVEIKRLILTNQLRPGQSIVIDQLAKELGVSHTPVREALATLQNDGLVRTRPYGNPIVAEIEENDVREAWEMRLLLEEWAVKQAVALLSEDEIAQIGTALCHARQEALQSRYEAHLKVDFALHGLIVEKTTNQLFQRLAESVESQSSRIRSLVEALGSREEILTIIGEHEAIWEAVRNRDADLARERLTSHLRAGMGRTLVALKIMQVAEPSETGD